MCEQGLVDVVGKLRRICRNICPAAVLTVILSGGCRLEQKDFLTHEERDWLDKNSGSIVVAPDPRWNVDKAVDQQQIYKGLTTDYMKLVEKKLGVRFMRLYTDSWEQVLEAEKRGEIDIHPVLARSEDRSRNWLFTDPYLRIPMIVVTRASLKDKFSPAKMRTMRMGVGHGFGIDEFVAEHCKDYNIVPVESDRFGLIEVSMGEIDLMITDLASASYYIESEGLTNLRLVATMGSLYEFCFASRRDEPLLHSILNKALKQITREERNAVYNRWIVFDTRPFYKNRLFWYSVIFAMFMVMVVITAILFWNSMLKAEVKVKTQELRLANEQLEQRVEERTEQLSEINKLLQQKIEERAVMARDLLHISGSERARIGRELHDSIGQEMVAITFLCRALEGRARESDADLGDGLARVSEHVEGVIAGMKRIVRGLLPVDIMDRGLVVALGQMAREVESTYNVVCGFECESEDALKISSNALATNIYRIAQEAVSNAVKHAGAKNIEISMSEADGKGILRVKDDGHGIDKSNTHAGMGLGIMRYRAELARGGLVINSSADGTEIICYFDPVADIEMH
jgi:signal transduction histidine kinase